MTADIKFVSTDQLTRDFLNDFGTLSTFGAVLGTIGVNREAGTAPDGEQRKWFAALMESHGFEVHHDAIGNLFGLFTPVPGAPYVLTGSHLDSQPTAGRYDGAFGVLASAHACFRVAELIRSGAITPVHNLAIVDWFNEEGSRFKPSMMGSGVFTGKLALETALSTEDRFGVTVQQALEELGERGTDHLPEVASYAEIHVQQGRSMEEDGLTIGLVNATWAAHKFEFVVHGEQAHTGSTIMRDRHDALLGASMIVVAARELADEFPEGELHTSVGELEVYPNSQVVIASRVSLVVDLRSIHETSIDRAVALLKEHIDEIAQRAAVSIELVNEHFWDVNPYTPSGVELSDDVADALGLAHDKVMTVAGHDSTNMKDTVPTVMLFVPSVDGISHNLAEYTKDEDIADGADMLTAVVERLSLGDLVARD